MNRKSNSGEIGILIIQHRKLTASTKHAKHDVFKWKQILHLLLVQGFDSIYPSYTLLITLALFFFFKWWDKIVQCLTAAGYSGVMPGYSPGGASLSLDKRALCREIAWRLAKDPKVGHVVVSLRLFGLGSSIVEGGGRVVGKSSWMLCVDSATIPSGHRMSGYLKSSVRWILRACQGHFRYHDFPMASDPRTQELGRTEPFWVTFPSHCISWDSIPSGQTLPNS